MSGAPVFPRSRPRVDSHLHLTAWWRDIQRTAYRPDLDYSATGLLAEMDRNQVDYALAIQMFQAPSQAEALAEGRKLFSASGGRLLPVATLDPTQNPAEIGEAIAHVEAEKPLFALKLYPGYLPFSPSEPRVDPVYELARRRHLPVLIHQGDTLDGLGLIKYARPLDIDEVAGRFRDVRFVLCHLGNPWIEEAAEIVYKNPNVFADTSGLLPHSGAPYFEAAVESARAAVQGAIVASGTPDRFLYGSDWPLEELELAIDLIESLRFRSEDVARIMGANAVDLFRIVGWSQPPPPR